MTKRTKKLTGEKLGAVGNKNGVLFTGINCVVTFKFDSCLSEVKFSSYELLKKIFH